MFPPRRKVRRHDRVRGHHDIIALAGVRAGEAGALVQSFWHGPVLTPYERLSIKSFIDCGHRFRLYTYDLRLDVPDGCEVADAAAILPEDRVFFYPGDRGRGSVAAFANLFRYKLLHDRGGWWVDTDIVCQARRLPGARYVFGYQSDGSINNAVLKCPAGSRLMQRCHEAAAAEGEDLRWGVTGPLLLSRLVIEQRLERFVADSRAFYPYDWREACLPSTRISPRVSSMHAQAPPSSICGTRH